jgi:hypothetical protein
MCILQINITRQSPATISRAPRKIVQDAQSVGVEPQQLYLLALMQVLCMLGMFSTGWTAAKKGGFTNPSCFIENVRFGIISSARRSHLTFVAQEQHVPQQPLLILKFTILTSKM